MNTPVNAESAAEVVISSVERKGARQGRPRPANRPMDPLAKAKIRVRIAVKMRVEDIVALKDLGRKIEIISRMPDAIAREPA